MPRARLRREPCDCLDCREPASGATPATASAAVARQEPPPKSLVLCLAGAPAPRGDDADGPELPHLDAAVAAGWAGLLACRAGGPPLPLQLLGLQQAGVAPQQSLPDRFKQLRAMLLSDSPDVLEAGTLAGCYAVHQIGSSSSSGGGQSGSSADGSPAGWPAPERAAAHICRLLRVQPLPTPGAEAAAPALAAVLAAAQGGPASSRQEGGEEEGEEEEEGDDVIDMLMLALDAARLPPGDEEDDSGVAALEWADSLVRCLNQVPGFRDTVLLSLVLGPGQGRPGGAPLLQQAQPLLQPGQPAAGAEVAAAGGAADCPAVLRPLQSYQFAGLDRVEVDACRPAVVVHRLPAVIRVDNARKLELAHITAHGAAGCILAERLLPEVAYKLGRAPKYGA